MLVFFEGAFCSERKELIGPDLKERKVVISRFALSYERKANLITVEAKMYELCNLCIDKWSENLALFVQPQQLVCGAGCKADFLKFY